MAGGYAGKVLCVNLTSGLTKEKPLPEVIYRDFIGGVGLGVKIVYERMKPNVDPLGPDNFLGFVPGLLTGTPVPMSSRCTVVTKSPLTGTWGDANMGGYLGPELKAAGYDGVFFTGISPKPVYLFIQDGKSELRDAGNLWGKDTIETVKAIRQEIGDEAIRIACIGPSGESLSLISSIISGIRVAGRSGVGAVMGVKKLKAIAVRGTGKVKVSHPETVSKLRKSQVSFFRKAQDWANKNLRDYGTSGFISANVKAGVSPIRNWSLIGSEAFPNADKIANGSVTKYQVRKFPCPGCPLSCSGIVEVKSGPYSVSGARKPEYETLVAFGTMLLNDDLESIIKANEICDRYGIDTISAGSVIAFAMECYERGIIGKQETEGIELSWGNAPAILALLEKIVRREGFGAVLADGVKRAAEQIGHGSGEFAIHVHGQEVSYHDPRFLHSRGMAYITDPTPGRHMVAHVMTFVEGGGALGPYPDLPTAEDEAAKYAIAGNYSYTFVASGLCLMAYTSTFPLVEFISAVTGWDFGAAEAIITGQRIQTLRQAFNAREGLLPREFSLPKRIAEPPSTGPFAGHSVDFSALKASYYEAMGWDTETGYPLDQTLGELGLKGLV
jgi:aldehyde:ferredoxin oxidoreductase